MTRHRQHIGDPGHGRRPISHIEACRLCLGYRRLARHLRDSLENLDTPSPCMEGTLASVGTSLAIFCPYEGAAGIPPIPLDRHVSGDGPPAACTSRRIR
jgi:hypothetical protein